MPPMAPPQPEPVPEAPAASLFEPAETPGAADEAPAPTAPVAPAESPEEGEVPAFLRGGDETPSDAFRPAPETTSAPDAPMVEEPSVAGDEPPTPTEEPVWDTPDAATEEPLAPESAPSPVFARTSSVPTPPVNRTKTRPRPPSNPHRALHRRQSRCSCPPHFLSKRQNRPRTQPPGARARQTGGATARGQTLDRARDPGPGRGRDNGARRQPPRRFVTGSACCGNGCSSDAFARLKADRCHRIAPPGLHTPLPRRAQSGKRRLHVGLWRSLVARPSGGRKVAGSSPASPTKPTPPVGIVAGVRLPGERMQGTMRSA